MKQEVLHAFEVKEMNAWRNVKESGKLLESK